MAKIVVVGNVNIETTVAVGQFPVAYEPVRYLEGGISQSVSAVGFNVAMALRGFGHEVRLLSIVGQDVAAGQIRGRLQAVGLTDEFVLGLVAETAQSVILYDATGRRQVHTDLKDLLQQAYPAGPFQAALAGCDAIVLTNINYARPLLPLARASGLPILTDVQTISQLDDPYNQDFMAAATLLFMSGEKLPLPPADWIAQLWQRYPAELVVIGQGADGATLGERATGRISHQPATFVDQIRSSGGAGDALAAAFLDGYLRGLAPLDALQQAQSHAASTLRHAASAPT
jgi:sugar/nucleoside kinase (ribokinase family)